MLGRQKILMDRQVALGTRGRAHKRSRFRVRRMLEAISGSLAKCLHCAGRVSFLQKAAAQEPRRLRIGPLREHLLKEWPGFPAPPDPEQRPGQELPKWVDRIRRSRPCLRVELEEPAEVPGRGLGIVELGVSGSEQEEGLRFPPGLARQPLREIEGGVGPVILQVEAAQTFEGLRVVGGGFPRFLEGLEGRVILPGPAQGPTQKVVILGHHVLDPKPRIDANGRLVTILVSRRPGRQPKGSEIFGGFSRRCRARTVACSQSPRE